MNDKPGKPPFSKPRYVRASGRKFSPGTQIELTETAIKDGCTPELLGSNRATVIKIDTMGLLRILVFGQRTPITHHPDYWRPVR